MSVEVWELEDDSGNYASLTFERDDDCEPILNLCGKPVLNSWVPPKVIHYRKPWKGRELLPFSDFPGIGRPVFTPKTMAVLLDLLTPNGELLPLDCPEGGEYYVFNAWFVEGALDLERSDFANVSMSREIVEAEKYIFFEEAIRDRAIFKIPEKRGYTFVTRPFVDRVREAGFTGFLFKEFPQS